MVFMSHPSEQMYEASAVKAHFSSFGFIYLALTAALVFAGILSLFLKKTPEKSGECDKYRRIEPLCALKTPFARIALLSVCAVLIVLGIVNGGLRDVFVKAVNICTECIGLG
ncbi:MAG: hypothetical protein IKJ65_02725 [Clostridia bacterium]|nr:hypothetical protein [Clostridia bacterium]